VVFGNTPLRPRRAGTYGREGEAKGLTLYHLLPYYRTLKWDEKAEIMLR
jgi:hypothetical protein